MRYGATRFEQQEEGGDRPALPDAIDDADAVEAGVRDVLVDAAARAFDLLAADLRADPKRGLRRLRVAERVAASLRAAVSELGIDDDEGADEDLGMGQAMGGFMPRRRRGRLGPPPVGMQYGNVDQQTIIANGIRAQHIQALVATLAQVGPNGAAPDAAVFESVARELRTLLPNPREAAAIVSMLEQGGAPPETPTPLDNGAFE